METGIIFNASQTLQRCHSIRSRVGFSQFLPGGGAGPDSTPFEKIYVVIEGEMTITIDGDVTTLKAMDSCTIAPNEERLLENRTNHVAKMIVVMPYPGGKRP